MPFGSEGLEPGIGLALSGGGFRATLFHVGACWRLVELGVLPKLSRISSVSGGSIFAGALAASWNAFRADPTVGTYQRLVVAPLRQFCRQNLDSPAIGEGLLVPWKSASDEIESKFHDQLFQIGLDGLPDTPRFIFNSTNLQTGRDFRFSKLYMGDYLIGLIRKPSVPLAKAVTASSAFPPFLSPVILDRPGTFEYVDGAKFNANPDYITRLYLSDGGVYDNLGLETVWNRCETLLVSDAGATFGMGPNVATDWVSETMRALDVATDQARALRKRALLDDFKRGVRSGTYWGIATKIDGYADHISCDDAIVSALADIRTRLNPFTDQEQEQLINWGYTLCDASVRTYAPQIIATDPAPVPKWPCKGHSLGP